MRQSWDDYFLDMAELVSTRSTCLKAQHGAVLAKDKRVISMGFNGSPENFPHCKVCPREGMPTGEHPELCRAVHAEQNAIINAARLGVSTNGSTLYITGRPCILCTKMLVNAGVGFIKWEDKRIWADDLLKKYMEAL